MMNKLTHRLAILLGLCLIFNVVVALEPAQPQTNVSPQNVSPQKESFLIAQGKTTEYPASMGLVSGDISLLKGLDRAAYMIGGTVNLDGPIKSSAYIVAGTLNTKATINSAAYFVAGSLVTAPESNFIKDALFITGTSNIEGNFHNNLTVIAGKTTINANVAKNLEIFGDNVVIKSTSVIAGKLYYQNPQALTIEKGAVIKGGVEQWRPQQKVSAQIRRWPSTIALLFNLGLWILGIILVLILPRFSRATVTTLYQKGLSSFLLGGIFVIVTPFIAAFLLISLIGAPIALVLGNLYFAGLVIGYVYFALTLGFFVIKWITGHSINTAATSLLIISTIIGLVILYLLYMIPYLGIWFLFAAFIYGFGGFIRSLYDAHRNHLENVPQITTKI